MLECFFEYVKSHERLFRVLLLREDGGAFSRRLIKEILQRYRNHFFPGEFLVENCESVYCVHGGMGLLEFWLEGGFPFSSRKLAELTLRMSIQATELEDFRLP